MELGKVSDRIFFAIEAASYLTGAAWCVNYLCQAAAFGLVVAPGVPPSRGYLILAQVFRVCKLPIIRLSGSLGTARNDVKGAGGRRERCTI